jgi:hypothetical protein
MKFTFQIHPDEFDEALVTRLQETYVDHVTKWSFEPDAEKISESLLTVIELFMTPSKYAEWYETIKEL